MPAERLTLDSSATIDLLNEDERRHPLALRLVELKKAGTVELAVAASGHVHEKGQDPARLHELEREGVLTTMHLAYPGVIYPGSNLFPGAFVPGFGAAWAAVLAQTGAQPRKRDGDALHVESPPS